MKFLVLIWVAFLMFSFTVSDTTSTSESYTLINSKNIAKPGCDSRCGDLIVPYPFGMGDNPECYIDKGFRIYCNTSLTPPKASIYKRGYTSIERISDSNLRTSNLVASMCYYPNGTSYNQIKISANYTTTPYTMSEVNKFTVIGCSDYAWLTSGTKSRNVSTGCMVFCSTPDEVVGDQCAGSGCCQSSIPNDINYYRSRLRTMLDSSDNVSYIRSFNPCTYAFIGEENIFNFSGKTDLLGGTSFRDGIESTVPRVLEWAIGNMSCSEAKATDGYACLSNSTCVGSERESGGYRCVCKEGYEGNPYLAPGCQDINECDNVEKFPCYGTCENTLGNYTCKCKGGYSGDGKTKDGCRRKLFNVLRFSIGLGIGCIGLLIGLSVLYFLAKKRKLAKQREKFYEQNGGALLEEKLKTTGGLGVGYMKVFQFEELKEATDNFAEDRILGRGGNGIVYEGTLADKCVVAIKKSQRLDQGQREQFINEMIILTQIKHQNVVQLLGCCLETDVPLLVYEFVPNDTLDHHIHNRKGGMGRLSWVNRLRIAHESAGALAYLHTNVRMTIIHRDVKSTNILLDENYTAKIADFGASRLVPLGHDQVSTLVQGTFGYLDPEYFQTGQLTDKSDVYSFGVVLAELITGKRPLGAERCLEDRNLATYFVKAKKEDRLHEILDRKIVEEATEEQLKAACDLVYRCLNLLGGNRPTMKEVTMELETLRKVEKHPWIHRESYNETSSLTMENEERDTIPLVVNSDTFGEYSSSSYGMKEIMLQVQDPR